MALGDRVPTRLKDGISKIMDVTSLAGVLWQVVLIEAIICLILLLSIIFALGRWRMAIRRKVARADRGAEALRRFSSAIARYVMYLKRHTSAIVEILGYTMSSLTKPRKGRAGVSEKFPSDMAEYAVPLKNNTSDIQSLSQALQELKEEVSRQHRILSDLLTAIEQAPARVEPSVETKMKPAAVSEETPPMEEEPMAKLGKGSLIPGHFRYRQQPAEEQKIAAKEAPAKKPSLATRHTLATKKAIANKAHSI